MVRLMNNKGFTLIEIAIGVIVIGLLTLPLIELYKTQIVSAKKTFNQGRFTDIRNKINEYVLVNNRYPRPSSLTAAPDDSDWGVEASLGPPPILPCVAWPTPAGVCRTASNDVYLGAVPVEELGLNEEVATDYWGNKILYAVTISKTVAYSNTVNGDVDIQGFGEVGVGLEAAEAHDFMLISHGESAAGAYSLEGNLVQACPGDTGTTDGENCDFDQVFIMQEKAAATDFGGGVASNETPGVNFYDDFTLEQQSIPLDLWNQSTFSANFAITPADRIGIGLEDPQAKVHVVGDVGAFAVETNEICDDSGVCFEPEIIGGNVNEMNCDANSLAGNEPVLWIANSQVYCSVPVDPTGNVISDGSPNGGLEFEFPDNAVAGAGNGFGRIDCADTGQLMVGIDTNGDPICATP